MPDLPKCRVTGYARSHDGSLMAGGKIRVHKVSMTGAAIENANNSIFDSAASGEDGKMEVDLPRGSTAYLSGPFTINSVDFNVDRNRNGRAVTVPDAEAADLEDLPTPSQVPSQGLTVKSDGEALGLFGALNFSDSFEVTQDGAQVDIDLADAGGGERLLSTTVVNLNTATPQDLYTVPAGKTLVVTKAAARGASVDLTGGSTTIPLKSNAAGTPAVLPAIDTTGLSAAAQVAFSTHDGSNYATVAAGGKVQAVIALPFGSAATATLDLFGYLY